MALQFTSIEEPSLARGIDARSAENQLRAGFARDLVNVDIVEGRASKRRGHISHAGYLPVRVKRAEKGGGKFSFILDSSIDLARLTSNPILVHGRSGSFTAGPFVKTGDSTKYYTAWVSNLRKILTATTPSGTLSVPQTEHNIDTSRMFVGVAEATAGGTSLSGSTISTQDIVVDSATYDISVDYSNNTTSDISAFIYYADQSLILGRNHEELFTALAGETKTHSILAATHKLDNYNIQYQLYYDNDGLWTQAIPESFIVNANDGEVTVTIVNGTSSPVNYRLLLAAVPSTQTRQSITATVGEYTVPDVENPYLFFTLYSRVGDVLTEVKPDTAVYNDTTKEWTLTWTENPTNIATLELYYSYGTIRTNKITVDDAAATGPTEIDLAPQLSIYGLSHADIYGVEKNVNRRGWVTHLDSYRSPTAAHMVSGLGGNIFAALGPEDTTIVGFLPTWYCNLNSRVSTLTVVGPAFSDENNTDKTRGVYYFSGGTFGWATTTSVTYDENSGNTSYVLSMPGGAKTAGRTPVAAGDYLTVENMSHSRHSGVFEIVSFDDTTLGSGYVTVVVKNPKLTTTDYNDTGTGGRAGVFTDQVVLTGNSPFIENDTLLSSAWGESTLLQARETPPAPTTTLLLKNCYTLLRLNAGLAITGKRTSNTISLRAINNSAPTSLFIVPGDVLSFSELARELRVTAVNTATNSVTVDEEVEWYDDLALPPSLTVARRWHPVEVPTPSITDVLVPRTTVQHFSANPYDSQPFLRSAMVSNNLYLTNGDDEVYKYDGSNIYRAGLIPWQPGLFAAIENVAGGGLALTPVEVTGGTFKGASIQVIATEGRKLKEGDLIQITFATGIVQTMTVAGISEVTNTNDVSLTFVESFSNVTVGTAISSIRLVYYASYFFRLNAKDRNGVVVASAVTGDESFIVQVVPSANFVSQRVLIRLVGMPPWDQYDYRNGNIELEIYRTPWTTKNVGESLLPYRLKTIPLTYEVNSGYLDFIDTYTNQSLSETDDVQGILSPTEIPVDWDEPVRAKYMTTTGNRLVLANITDWPQLTVNYITTKDTGPASFVGQRFLFRRDNTVAGNVTNMLDRVGYEIRGTSDALSCYPTVTASNNNTFSFTTAIALPASLTEGDWVYLYHNAVSNGNSQSVTAVPGTGANQSEFNIVLPNNTLVHFTSSTNNLPSPLVANRGYFVVNADSNSIQVAETYGGGRIALTTTGANVSILWDGSELTYAGWWQIASRNLVTNNVVVRRANTNFTALPTQFPDRALFATDPTDVPVLVGTDGNLATTFGNSIVTYISVIHRLGMAINASMRVVDTQIPGYENFRPWLTARSEAATDGQLIVKRPRADAEVPSLTMTAAGSGAVPTYINSEVAVVGTSVSASITRYPSRVLISYNSYPEIFSNPFALTEDSSDSLADINAADGQEITGVVPFFGSSAFDAAQQSGVLIVFKTNSIYVLKVNTREVQKLDTQGLGCSAPYSIAPTKDGIAFANETGIYVLRPSLRIEYLGRYLERNWQQAVDLNKLDLVQGHHYGTGRQYKLSVPLAEDSTASYGQNEEVYTYNYTGEADGEPGGWTRYTNHPATGWANLFQNAYFATVDGTVMRLRNLNEPSDYRDQDVAITSIIQTRPTAFENTAIRKAVSNIVVHYRSAGDSDNTSLGMALDMANEYQLSTAYRVVTAGVKDGLSSTIGQSVVSVMHSFPKRKCIYASVQIVNSGIDENVEVAGMSYVVAGLSGAGIKQAAETEG